MKRLALLLSSCAIACSSAKPEPVGQDFAAFQSDPAVTQAADRAYRQDVSRWLEERGYPPMTARLEIITSSEAAELLRADSSTHPDSVYEELGAGANAAVVRFEPRPDVPTAIVHVFREVDGKLYNTEYHLGLEPHVSQNPQLGDVPEYTNPPEIPVVSAATLIPAQSTAAEMLVLVTSQGCAFSNAISAWLPGMLASHGLAGKTVDFAEKSSDEATFQAIALQLLAGRIAFPALVLIRDGAPVDRQFGLDYWRTTNFLRANGMLESDVRWVDDYRATPKDREAWLRWLSVRRELSDGNFTDLDLSEAVLRDANFARSVLVNADFTGADLRRASFRHADLTGAKFPEAFLTGADFTGATCPDGEPAVPGEDNCRIR